MFNVASEHLCLFLYICCTSVAFGAKKDNLTQEQTRNFSICKTALAGIKTLTTTPTTTKTKTRAAKYSIVLYFAPFLFHFSQPKHRL